MPDLLVITGSACKRGSCPVLSPKLAWYQAPFDGELDNFAQKGGVEGLQFCLNETWVQGVGFDG